MKKLKQIVAVFILFLYAGNTDAQTQTIIFTHDAGGHIVQRSVQVSSFRLGNFNLHGDTTQTKQLEFTIFPNPANTYLTIEGKLPENTKEATVHVYNISGQLLKTVSYNGQAKQLSVSDLQNGMYLLEINYSKKSKSTYKIIITN